MLQVVSVIDLTEKCLSSNVLEMPDYEQEQWLVEVGQLLANWEMMENYSIMQEAKILYKVWSVWECDNNPDNYSIIRTATYKWDHDFYKWAKSFTQFRAYLEPANSTIDNKVAIYRDYIAEELIEHPKTVKIPKRDIYGQLVDKTLESEEGWETIEVDLMLAGYGKLLMARGNAKKGILSEDSWSAIMDPHVSVRELKKRIKQDINGNGEDDSEDFHIEEQEGIIYGVEGGHRVAVLAALWENKDDPLFIKTLSHIFASNGLKMPLMYK